MNIVSRLGMMGVVLVSAMVGLAGCASRPRGPMNVPLVFKPTDQLNIGAASGVMNKTVTVVVEDHRDKKDEIGVNTEKEIYVPITTKSDPSAFVKQALTRNLSSAGVRVEPNGERVVEVILTRFWVEEGSTYKGNVAATVRVTPAGGGTPLWEGQATGTNTRFGRSLSVENYQEVFSDSVMQLSNHLLADEGFRAALK